MPETSLRWRGENIFTRVPANSGRQAARNHAAPPLSSSAFTSQSQNGRNPVPPGRRQRGLSVVTGKLIYSFAFNSLPAANLTVFDFLILIFAPVFGFTPIRAARSATRNVPNPTSCTVLL